MVFSCLLFLFVSVFTGLSGASPTPAAPSTPSIFFGLAGRASLREQGMSKLTDVQCKMCVTVWIQEP